MRMNPDVLNDLCRRIRTGHAVASDADFLEWVFRDQAGWIKPEQGRPGQGDYIEFIGGGDLDEAYYIARGTVTESGEIHFLVNGLQDGHIGLEQIHAWRPAPQVPDWLFQPVSEG